MPANITKLIPHALTSANLASGILAILLVDPQWSPLLIILASVFDAFDGAAARFFNVQGEFGKELDSLADLVSFGIAPVIVLQALYINSELLSYTLVIWAGLCTAWRLAKFNTLPPSDEFLGLPSPSHGLFVTGLTISLAYDPVFFTYITDSDMTLSILSIFVSTLMILPSNYISLKGLGSSLGHSIQLSVVGIAGLIALIFYTSHTLWIVFAAYIIMSFVNSVLKYQSST